MTSKISKSVTQLLKLYTSFDSKFYSITIKKFKKIKSILKGIKINITSCF